MVDKNGASLMSFCEDVFCWLYAVPPVAFLFGKYSPEERLVLNFFVLGGRVKKRREEFRRLTTNYLKSLFWGARVLILEYVYYDYTNEYT